MRCLKFVVIYKLRKRVNNMAKKLEVQDYVFEYNGEDLRGAELKCTFKNKDKEKYEQITFEISALDKDGQEYSLEFDLVNISLDKLTDKLIKVNSHLLSSAYFYIYVETLVMQKVNVKSLKNKTLSLKTFYIIFIHFILFFNQLSKSSFL